MPENSYNGIVGMEQCETGPPDSCLFDNEAAQSSVKGKNAAMGENDEECNEIDLFEQSSDRNGIDDDEMLDCDTVQFIPDQVKSDINIQMAESSNSSGFHEVSIQEEGEEPKVTTSNVECSLDAKKPEMITSSKRSAIAPTVRESRLERRCSMYNSGK